MAVKTTLYSEIASHNRPSFYAPPVAWAVAQFTQALIEEERGILPDHTGMLVASDECSLETVREIANTALRGTVSPLRFAGSSPSILVGLPALQRGIRGPSLCLTMRPEHAAPAMLAMIRYWVEHNAITAVIAIAHHRQGKDHLLKGLIARSIDDALTQQIGELGYC